MQRLFRVKGDPKYYLTRADLPPGRRPKNPSAVITGLSGSWLSLAETATNETESNLIQQSKEGIWFLFLFLFHRLLHYPFIIVVIFKCSGNYHYTDLQLEILKKTNVSILKF